MSVKGDDKEEREEVESSKSAKTEVVSNRREGAAKAGGDDDSAEASNRSNNGQSGRMTRSHMILIKSVRVKSDNKNRKKKRTKSTQPSYVNITPVPRRLYNLFFLMISKDKLLAN